MSCRFPAAAALSLTLPGQVKGAENNVGGEACPSSCSWFFTPTHPCPPSVPAVSVGLMFYFGSLGNGVEREVRFTGRKLPFASCRPRCFPSRARFPPLFFFCAGCTMESSNRLSVTTRALRSTLFFVLLIPLLLVIAGLYLFFVKGRRGSSPCSGNVRDIKNGRN